MPPRSRKWLVVVPLIALAVWLGGRWWSQGSDAPTTQDQQGGPSFAGSDHIVYRDGAWVRVGHGAGPTSGAPSSAASEVPAELVQVRGTVRDLRARTPVAGAEVVFASQRGEASTVADSQGRYAMTLHAGRYRGFARAEGYIAVGRAEVERLPQAPDPGAIGMPQDELAPLVGIFRDLDDMDMSLASSAVITGTVSDGAGRPVAGARLRAQLAGYYRAQVRPILGTHMGESDRDGGFQLEVPAGSIAIEAFHDLHAGLDGSPHRVFVEPGQDLRVELTMKAGCIITGRVVNPRGEPVGEGSLETQFDGPPPNDFAPAGAIDSQGRFRLARTEVGAVTFRAWPWKSPPSEPRTIACTDGARHELTLQVPDAEADLSGQVVSADGAAISHAFIDLFPLEPGGGAQQERADRHGEWGFYAVPPGKYHVTAYVPGQGIAASRVTVPERGVRLSLSGVGSIAGTVQGMESGSFQFTMARCLALFPDGSTARTDDLYMPRSSRLVPVENGAFLIDDLPACQLHAVVRTPYRSERVRVEISAGKSAPLRLDLRQARVKTVYGEVVDGDGRRLAEVQVSRQPGPGSPLDEPAYVTSDDSGRYEIKVYTGDILHFTGVAGSSRVTVSWNPGETERVDVQLRSPGDSPGR